MDNFFPDCLQHCVYSSLEKLCVNSVHSNDYLVISDILVCPNNWHLAKSNSWYTVLQKYCPLWSHSHWDRVFQYERRVQDISRRSFNYQCWTRKNFLHTLCIIIFDQFMSVFYFLINQHDIFIMIIVPKYLLTQSYLLVLSPSC